MTDKDALLRIDDKEAAANWRSAEVECRVNWAKAANLPPMPSELLLIAKDPLIGRALADWAQKICELVVSLRQARITAALAEKDGGLPFNEGVQHMLQDFPRFVEEKALNMKKIKLADGRDALIRLIVTCDEHELDWYERDWQPLPPLPKGE